MSRARMYAVALCGVLLFASSCGELEPCGVTGVTEVCACGGGMQGARVCTAAHTWAACDCSGAIALPKAVGALDAGGGTGGQGGMSAGGVGGTSISGTTGGAQPPLDSGEPDDDSGIDPIDGGGVGGGGSGGVGGSGGSGDSGGSGGSGGEGGSISPNDAYLGCATTADCQANAECVITPGFPANASFCSQTCMVVSECPVPEGMYEAVVQCVTGYCKIDCTPVLFAPLLTCPTGMACVAPLGGLSYCHDDGV